MLLKKGIPWTYVLGKIKYEIVIVLIYSILIGIWHSELDLNGISIPLAIPAILGTVISLLLAFNSNQAYDRWWEARTVWGAIVNDSRTLIRQMQTFIRNPDFSPETERFIERFGKRQIFWVYSLGKSLRGQDPFQGNTNLISDDEQRFARRHTNIPNALISLHAFDIRHALDSGALNVYQQVQIDQTLVRLCDSMGKCERIKKTVFPTTYSMYIHFSLYLFIVLLPFGMTEYLGFVQVPIVVAIASSFLLIEKMAVYLQDPFENKPTDTPVTAIAHTIENDLLQMMSSDMVFDVTRTSEHQIDEVYFVL